MHIIKISALSNGAHLNQCPNSISSPPDGWAMIPEDFPIPDTFPFVDIEAEEVTYYIAKGMSWIKTKMELAINDSDKTIADLMTDGCNMGVKSLCRYLNQYEAADEKSKDIAKRLIKLEQQLAVDIQQFL